MLNANNFTTGIVKSWMRDFGFIREDGTGQEVFAHFTAIVGFGLKEYKYLVPGARYRFLKVPSPKIEGAYLALCVERESENDSSNTN